MSSHSNPFSPNIYVHKHHYEYIAYSDIIFTHLIYVTTDIWQYDMHAQYTSQSALLTLFVRLLYAHDQPVGP